MLYTETRLMPEQSLIASAKDYQHGDSEPLHSHSCAQLIHPLSGVIMANTQHGSWLVPAGRGLWLPAGLSHSLRFIGNVSSQVLFVDPLARADLSAQCQVVEISPLLRELINVAIDIAPDYRAGGRDERVMELILDELRILPILSLHLPQPRDKVLKALCVQIQQAPGLPWAVEEAAGYLAISSRTLSRRFQRETGLRFSDWVRRAKLLHGINALGAGNSVLDVALELGYDSPSAFSAMFRRSLGVSPSEYLGLHQGK